MQVFFSHLSSHYTIVQVLLMDKSVFAMLFMLSELEQLFAFAAVRLVARVLCGCEAHFRRWLPGWDHQCVYSVSAAGGFLASTEDVLGHAAGWRRGKPGEEPAGICCEAHLHLLSDSVKYKLYYLCWPIIFLSPEDLVSSCQIWFDLFQISDLLYRTLVACSSFTVPLICDWHL